MERSHTCHSSDSTGCFPLYLELYAPSAPVALFSQHKELVNTDSYHDQHMCEWMVRRTGSIKCNGSRKMWSRLINYVSSCGLIIALLQICRSVSMVRNFVSVMWYEPSSSYSTTNCKIVNSTSAHFASIFYNRELVVNVVILGL
jgi:hypothetical protein